MPDVELRAIREPAYLPGGYPVLPRARMECGNSLFEGDHRPYARRKLTNPRVVYPNWRMTNASEVSTGAGTIKVSLEYPAGVYTLANECIADGNAAVAFPSGNTALTFNVTVPSGAKFWLRPWVVIPSGVNWTQMGGGNNSDYAVAPGDLMDISTNPRLPIKQPEARWELQMAASIYRS